MKLYTIGYGGRTAAQLISMLQSNGIRTVVDVRLRPDRASMGAFVKAKTPDKGIEAKLSEANIGYCSLVELGNVFLDCTDWQKRYQELIDAAGDLLTSRLAGIPEPFCLLCAERSVAECHRRQIADYLKRSRGAVVEHL